MVKKVLFVGQIFEIEILVDLHFLRTPESENHIFRGWSVCVCLLSVWGGRCLVQTNFLLIPKKSIRKGTTEHRINILK